MKKQICVALASFLLLMTLAGCGPQEQSAGAPAGPASAAEEPGPLHLLSSGTEQGYYHMEGDDLFGNYATGGSVILFADYESGREVPLCADPACTHSGETCTAWVRPWEMGGTALLVEGQTLLGWGNGAADHPYTMTAMDLDGGHRRTLCELGSGESWGYTFFFPQWGMPLETRCAGDGQTLYFPVRKGDGEGSTVELRSIPLAGGEQKTVAAIAYEDVHLGGVLGRELIVLARDIEAKDGDEPWYMGAVVRLLAVNVDTGAQREAASWPLEDFALGTCGPDAYYDVEKATGHIWKTDLATGARADTGLPGPEGCGQDSTYLEGVYENRLMLTTWIERNGVWVMVRWAVDLDTGETAEISLGFYLEEKMDIRPMPVLAQTGDGVYMAEERRTEHRTLPGRSGTPEEHVYTTNICCLVPKEDFFASDLRRSRRVLPWGME